MGERVSMELSRRQVLSMGIAIPFLPRLDSPLPPFDPELLVSLMTRDKKALQGLTFVLDGEMGVEVVAGVPQGAAIEALSMMAAS